MSRAGRRAGRGMRATTKSTMSRRQSDRGLTREAGIRWQGLTCAPSGAAPACFQDAARNGASRGTRMRRFAAFFSIMLAASIRLSDMPLAMAASAPIEHGPTIIASAGSGAGCDRRIPALAAEHAELAHRVRPGLLHLRREIAARRQRHAEFLLGDHAACDTSR